MLGMVMHQGIDIELLDEFWHRRIIDTEEEWLILQGRRNQTVSRFCRLQTKKTTRYRFIRGRSVTTIQSVMRHLGQEIPVKKEKKWE